MAEKLLKRIQIQSIDLIWIVNALGKKLTWALMVVNIHNDSNTNKKECNCITRNQSKKQCPARTEFELMRRKLSTQSRCKLNSICTNVDFLIAVSIGPPLNRHLEGNNFSNNCDFSLMNQLPIYKRMSSDMARELTQISNDIKWFAENCFVMDTHSQRVNFNILMTSVPWITNFNKESKEQFTPIWNTCVHS